MTIQDIEIEKKIEEETEQELEELDEQEEIVAQTQAPRKKRRLAKKLFAVIALCFCVYAAFTIIYDKAEIARLKTETQDINRQIDEERALNDEYSRMLDGGEKEYMKKIAIDKLGYAYPEERRFYIVNQND